MDLFKNIVNNVAGPITNTDQTITDSLKDQNKYQHVEYVFIGSIRGNHSAMDQPPSSYILDHDTITLKTMTCDQDTEKICHVNKKLNNVIMIRAETTIINKLPFDVAVSIGPSCTFKPIFTPYGSVYASAVATAGETIDHSVIYDIQSKLEDVTKDPAHRKHMEIVSLLLNKETSYNILDMVSLKQGRTPVPSNVKFSRNLYSSGNDITFVYVDEHHPYFELVERTNLKNDIARDYKWTMDWALQNKILPAPNTIQVPIPLMVMKVIDDVVERDIHQSLRLVNAHADKFHVHIKRLDGRAIQDRNGYQTSLPDHILDTLHSKIVVKVKLTCWSDA